MEKIAIATPTYNEVVNIKTLIERVGKVVKKIPDISFTLFVIDDNSPDKTAKVAMNYAKEISSNNFEVRVLVRKTKDGIGKAYIYGFHEILKDDYDFVIQIDADLSHNPKYLKDLVDQARLGKDFVTTSRYTEGGGIADWGLHRKILSRGGNIYARVFLDRRITDYTSGLNMYSIGLLEKIDIDTLSSSGYGFFIELKCRALKHCKNFAEIPLILTDRVHGKSKMPKSTIWINFVLVPKLRFKKDQ